MGLMIAGWTRLRALFEHPVLPVRAGMVCLGIAMMLCLSGAPVFAQGRFTEVLVSVVKNKDLPGVPKHTVVANLNYKFLGHAALNLNHTWRSKAYAYNDFANKIGRASCRERVWRYV